MDTKELRAMDEAQLVEKLGEARRELFDLRFQHATAQLENTRKLTEAKRTIARILTIQQEKKGD